MILQILSSAHRMSLSVKITSASGIVGTATVIETATTGQMRTAVSIGTKFHKAVKQEIMVNKFLCSAKIESGTSRNLSNSGW